MNILKEVTDLENKQQWQEAKEILFEQWKKNKDNPINRYFKNVFERISKKAEEE